MCLPTYADKVAGFHFLTVELDEFIADDFPPIVKAIAFIKL
jgi:hypothetical protein